MIQEAQNAGLPIIASDISCHTALLGSAYVGLHSAGSAIDVSEKLHLFFDELCRKQMEKQLSSCPAARSTLGRNRKRFVRFYLIFRSNYFFHGHLRLLLSYFSRKTLVVSGKSLRI